ncbi:MAG: DUF5334 family protein [Pseudomonadota bacterium]
MKYLVFAMLAALALSCSPVIAWDGYDWEANSDITIESGNLVRYGEEIEYYDWGENEYKYGVVERIDRFGSMVEVEIYDYQEGEYRTFEMYD